MVAAATRLEDSAVSRRNDAIIRANPRKFGRYAQVIELPVSQTRLWLNFPTALMSLL